MLTECQIKNFTIIEQNSLHFSDGMTVLTGETGAGKSILVDAVGLLLGARSDSKWVRPGASAATITGMFELSANAKAQAWLQANDLADAENQCVIRRIISADGRSKAYINDTPVTIKQLQKLAPYLVAIHGQHEHHALLKPAYQKQRLDFFAQAQELVQQADAAYRQWQQCQAKIAELKEKAKAREEGLSLLQYQVAELEELACQEGEVAALYQEHKQLSHGQQLITNTAQVLEKLSEAEDFNVIDTTHAIWRQVQELKAIDQRLEQSEASLEQAAIVLAEAADELKNYYRQLDVDPQRLHVVESRMEAIHDLARKHGVEPERLFDHYQQLTEQLASWQQSSSDLTELEQQQQLLQAKWQQLAGELTASRSQSAKKLQRQVTAMMQQLGMEGGKFAIMLQSVADDQPRPGGQENIQFQVTTNPGSPLNPLSDVVSGGELSRISLALQALTLEAKPTPTLIFDEVDVGIGGQVAAVVGEMLRQLGQSCQVLCVTHLPQVASQAGHHYFIAKHKSQEQTTSSVTQLEHDSRVEEIARMLGGKSITATTLDHARELLGASHSGS